jgi:hypothetical protein
MTRTKTLRNKRARMSGEESILALADHGFSVTKMTQYQFRVDDRLDLYPVNRRWHDVVMNTRGDYDGLTPLEICRRVFR